MERLLRMRGPEGGFYPGYDYAGTYAGTLTNAETTSIVIIVLSQLKSQPDPCLSFPLLCPQQLLSWTVLYVLIAVVAGAAFTLGFIYWERRRARRRAREHY